MLATLKAILLSTTPAFVTMMYAEPLTTNPVMLAGLEMGFLAVRPDEAYEKAHQYKSKRNAVYYTTPEERWRMMQQK